MGARQRHSLENFKRFFMTVSDRIRVKDVRLLSDNYYILKTATFEWRRGDGEWQIQHREFYDRGNGAALLPYNLARRMVVLVRQFRYPAFVNGHDDLLIEPRPVCWTTLRRRRGSGPRRRRKPAIGSAKSKKCSKPS
jgi:hypothetical protein